MEVGQKLGIWFTDKGARDFLGLDTQQGQSRWLLIGKLVRPEAGVGLWVDVERVEQWKATTEEKYWEVGPSVCLIRWDSITHAQELAGDRKAAPLLMN